VNSPAKHPRRKINSRAAAKLAALDVPSLAETQAAIRSARLLMPITEFAALIRCPLGTLYTWEKGERRPCATVRYFIGKTLERLLDDRQRAEKRHQQYLRRKERQSAGIGSGEVQIEGI
jgi:hypothetical protein